MLQRKEMTALLVTVISVKMLLTFPRMMIMNSGNSAWLEAIYNIAVIALIFLVTTLLYRGNKNIIQLAKMSGGKGLQIFIGTLTVAGLMINFSSIIRIFPETVKIVLLQDFELEVIIIVFLIAAAVGAYLGIEAASKINCIFVPIAGIVFLAFVLLLIPYYRVDNLLPILGNGVKSIFVSGLNTISLFADILILNLLLPRCENYSEAKKSGWRGILIGGAVALVILLCYCLIYPYPVSKNFIVPVYQLARIIHLSNFFSRFEALFQFIWSILVLLYASIYIYAICYTLQTMFDLKYYKPLVFPVTIICGVIALLPDSFVSSVRVEKLTSFIVYPIAFLLPLIFALVSRKFYGVSKALKEESSEE